MYIGRFLVIAPGYGAYRVSSRSFPDRVIQETESGLSVVPEGSPDNPYVSYNCLRKVSDGCVLGNGSHVDPVAEKIQMGYPSRDALSLALLSMDYEKDDYDTPRIAGYVGDSSYIGIVTKDSLIVEEVDSPCIVATYEIQRPKDIDFDVESVDEAAKKIYELEYEHPVASCAYMDGSTAVFNG